MIPSATTQPRDRKYWTAVIHNAAQVPPEHPRYGEARAVIQMAKDSLGNQAEMQNAADQLNAAPPTPGKFVGTAMNALQGLTAGLGDESLGGLAGLVTYLTSGGDIQQANNRLQQTTEGFREQRGNFFQAQPALSIAGNIYGATANPLNKVLGPLTAGLGPVATGAITGTTLGAAQGFGEATGSVKERLPGAVIGGVAGLVTGAAVGKLLPSLRMLRTNVRGMVRDILGPKAAPAQVNQAVESVMETAIRKDLTGRLNVHPDDVEGIVTNWRKTGQLDLRAVRTAPKPPEPPAPPITRPGETLTPSTPIVGTRPLGLPQTEAELLAMEPDAIAKTAQALQRHEAGAAQEVFGAAKAKQYEAAQRLVNSRMGHLKGARYEEAGRLIDQMESGLTPAQQTRLFGIGETGPNFESVRELANHASNYGASVLADTPTAQLQASFSALAGGERSTNDLLAQYALPRVYRELVSRGLSDTDIITKTLARMGERGISTETAGEALAARMNDWRQMFTVSPVVRPGETIKGFAVSGPRATPPAPTTPTILEMQQGRSLAAPADATATSPYDQSAAARAAYHIADQAGLNPTEAARRAAGTYSNFDPRQALLLALLAGAHQAQGSPR